MTTIDAVAVAADTVSRLMPHRELHGRQLAVNAARSTRTEQHHRLPC